MIPTGDVLDGVGDEINNLKPNKEGGHSNHKWGWSKVVVYECVCGEIVMPVDIEAQTSMIESKKRDWKTRWVSTFLL